MRTLIRIIVSPIFLSLIPFLIICFTVPVGLNKYSLKFSGKSIFPENYFVLYDDLDNDGSSEKIVAFDQNYTTAITIQNEDGFLDQWNFKGSFDFWFKTCLFIAGDKDGNGQKELYVFTLNKDTVFLHCISDFRKPDLSIKNRVIAITGAGNLSPDPFIIPADMDDLDGDSVRELIFGISTGFSRYPRNVFAYYVSKDSLVKSPESSYFISSILQTDINNDGRKEIIPYGYATSNVSRENAKYHDHSSFLMVLDQNLKFLFEPVEFTGKYSVLAPIFLKRTADENLTPAWFQTSASNEINPTLYFINNSGKITDSVSTNKLNIIGPKDLRAFHAGNGLLQVNLNNDLGLFNIDFKLIKTIPGLKLCQMIFRDFDTDGKVEILAIDTENSKISIFREGFKQPVSVTADPAITGPILVSVNIRKRSVTDISFQSGINHYLLHYGKSVAYPFNYLYYPGIYLSILVFALAIKSIQKNQSRKKYETEKRIAELQLAMIRNQLDPHFSFNVINSIICSVEFRENGQAATQLRQFANMYRNMLLTAGATRRTIDEELDFCNNYLLLEKTRFREKFNYNISVAEEIDRNLLIPKLLIQIHAENAIKHGLASLEVGGILNIELLINKGDLIIEITDNGIGREKSSAQEKTSTGKGLESMQELYSVYNKYYNEKISSQILDLHDNQGNPAGTKVIISIRKQNE